MWLCEYYWRHCVGLLPIAALVALYYVKEIGTRISLVAVFTSVFSFALALMAKGRGSGDLYYNYYVYINS
jgi:hypothetical protein